MNGTAFKLGTFARPNGAPFCRHRVGDNVIELAQAASRASGRALARDRHRSACWTNWDANFAVVAGDRGFAREGRHARRHQARGPAPAVAGHPPGQDVLRRAELPGARRRDDPRRHVAEGRSVEGREGEDQALPVPEGAELPGRRQRRHRNPARRQQGRLGGRDRAASSARTASASRPSARSTTSRAS